MVSLPFPPDKLRIAAMDQGYQKKVEILLRNALYEKREEMWLHIPYEQELVVLDRVKKGDDEGIRRIGKLYKRKDLHDHLSENPLRQRKYELVAMVTLVCRFAVEGGLDVETSYSLADAYIRAGDLASNQYEIFALMEKLPLDFAARVRRRKEGHHLSKPVLRCLELIDSKLHAPLSLGDLAAYSRRNPAYISVLFKKEMGVSVMEYLTRKRIEEAKEMLAHTELPIAHIADTLAFRSPSYFSQTFRGQTGQTPRQYRLERFRAHHAGRED
jgi:YesN/AraC family two-component response regulator